MRFGLVHRVMTDALAVLGVLALIASGQFNRWVSGIILVGLALAVLMRESWQRHPVLRHLDTGALVLLVVVQVARVFLNANVLDVLVEFAAALQVIRLATRKGAAHDQQIIVLALLHLIAGTVLGGGLGYGLCFLGVLVVAPGALVLSHLRREVEGNYRQGARDRTGLPVDVPRILRSRRVVGRSFLGVTCLLSIPIFLFTAALFVVFPRVGLSLLLLNRSHPGRMIGFSPRVDLGQVGTLRTDHTLAMRIELPEHMSGMTDPPPPRFALHLRGTALDSYDGRAWSQSQDMQRAADLENDVIPTEAGRPKESDNEPVMRIDLEPIDPPVIFLPPNATGFRFRNHGQLGVDALQTAYRRAEGEFRYSPNDERGLKYDVLLSTKDTPSFSARLTPEQRARYLQLPPGLPDRVRDLARDWTRGAQTPYDRARVIARHLTHEYRYDLSSPSGGAKEPLDDFLFESKRGHCEFYSTAMAVLLRVVDVPTRNVTGFIGGTYNKFGHFYAVRQGDAHSWVEVYLEDRGGWVTFDPTPSSDALPQHKLDGAWAFLRDFLEATTQHWERHVVGYDLHQQVGLFQSLTSRYHRGTAPWQGVSRSRAALVLGALALVTGALSWLWRRRKRLGPKTPYAEGARSQSALLATSLYETLEAAMSARGITRSPGTPPLRHAEALAGIDHPLAPEVLDLTSIYLQARFGKMVLSDDMCRDFERRVRTLRQPHG